MKNLLLTTGVAGLLLINGCGGTGSSNESSGQKAIIELGPDLSLDESLSVVEQDGQNPQIEATVGWSEYTSNWEVPAGSVAEQKDWLVQHEKDQLDFLISNFNPTDELESEVYEDLTSIRQSLEETGEMPVEVLEVDAGAVPENLETNPSVASVEIVEENDDADEDDDEFVNDGGADESSDVSAVNIGSEYCDYWQAGVCDVTGDGVTVPASGRSIVSSTGSLQKFWLSDESVEWFDENGGGIEIKTVIKNRGDANCGKEWNTNLAGKKHEGDTTDATKGKYVYRDTEALDNVTGPGHRVCGIGHLEAKRLKAGKMYFTWHTFKKLKENKNPQITIEWAPTDQVGECLNVAARGLCARGDIAWCRCSREDMPIEYLIQYNYQDHSGIELSWNKN